MMKARNVQCIICLVILLLCTNHAWASDWIFYGALNIGNEYYDKSSVKNVNKNIIRVWTKTLYNDVGKLKNYSALKELDKAPVNPYILSHEMVLFEIDCLNAKIKVSSKRICDKRGNIVSSEPQSHEKWKAILSGSNFERLKNEVCSAENHSNIIKK
jgi:hypothetical protein